MAREIRIRIGAESKVQPTLDEISKAFESMGADVEDVLDDVNEKAKEAGKDTGSAFSGIAGAAKKAFSFLPGIAGAAFKAVSFVFSGIASVVGGVFTAAVSVAQTALSALVSVATTVAKGIIGAFKIIPGAIGLVFNKITAIATIAAGFIVTKFAALAASSQDLNFALNSLAKAAGTTGKEIKAAITEGSLGAIGGLQAIQLANNALLLDVAKTPAEFRQLAEAALVLGRAMGRNLNDAFGDIVIGIGRMSKPILDNLGIITQMEAAVSRFAGRKISLELTKREKTLVLLTAAQKKMGDDTKLATFSTEEQATAFAETQRRLLDVAKATGDFSRILSKVSIEEALAAEGAVKLQKGIAGLSEEERKLAFLEATLEGARLKIEQAGGVTDSLSVKFQRLRNVIADVFVEIAETLAPAFSTISGAIEPLVKRFRDLVTANRQFIQSGLRVFLARVGAGAAEVRDRFTALIVNTAELREAIGPALSKAWEIAKNAGVTALRGVFIAAAFVVEEFKVLRDGLRSFLAGDDFNTSGSGIFALFDLLGKNIELFAVKAELILRDKFGSAFAFIADEVNRLNRITDDTAGVFQNFAGLVQKAAGATVSFFPDEDIQKFGADPNLGERLTEAGQARIDRALELFTRGRSTSTAAGLVSRRLAGEASITGLESARDESLNRFVSILADAVPRGDQLQEDTSAFLEARLRTLLETVDRLTILPDTAAEVTEKALNAVDKSAEKNLQATEAIVERLDESEAKALSRDARIEALLERGRAAGNTIYPKPALSIVPARS